MNALAWTRIIASIAGLSPLKVCRSFVHPCWAKSIMGARSPGSIVYWVELWKVLIRVVTINTLTGSRYQITTKGYLKRANILNRSKIHDYHKISGGGNPTACRNSIGNGFSAALPCGRYVVYPSRKSGWSLGRDRPKRGHLVFFILHDPHGGY